MSDSALPDTSRTPFAKNDAILHSDAALLTDGHAAIMATRGLAA